MNASSAPEITHQVRSEIGRLSGEFCAKLPPAAVETGRYEAQPGDRYSGLRFAAPDGTYRLVGAEWLFTVRANKFAAAERVPVGAEPEGVIHIGTTSKPIEPSSVGQSSSIPVERR